MGDVLYRLKRYEAAIAVADQALALNDRQMGALRIKSKSLHKLHRDAEALATIDLALTIDANPQSYFGYRNGIGKAILLEQMGRIGDAQALRALYHKYPGDIGDTDIGRINR